MSLLSDTYDPEPTILTPYCCVISREAEKITFIVFGLILLGFKRTIYTSKMPKELRIMQFVFCFVLYYDMQVVHQ
jgi:hypothetical protein